MNAARRAAPQFRVGDRVRLSKLGKSGAPRTKIQTGVVFRVPEPSAGGMSIQVIFDGNRQPTRIHRSYIELDADTRNTRSDAGMANRIRIIPHEGVPNCGSYEVRFPDGRESIYFYWDDDPGRRSITMTPP